MTSHIEEQENDIRCQGVCKFSVEYSNRENRVDNNAVLDTATANNE